VSPGRDFKAEVAGVSVVEGPPVANPIEYRAAPPSAPRLAGNPSNERFRLARLGYAAGLSASDQEDLKLRAREEPWNTESYKPIEDNAFLAVPDHPLSTFSIDVDTASYANVRRFLTTGALPPPDAVRIEELINYFDYDYPAPTGTAPFSTDVAIVDCPWNPSHRLARIGIKGREIHRTEHVGSNLVFLIDVSGSMDHPSKLPLLKSALVLLVEQLTSRDQVAMVVYAGSSGLVLDATSGDAKAEILDAIDRLEAGGSTNGGAGLQLAYRIARENFIPGGVNRVILATDGDFNVGVTGHGDLLRSIESDAKNGIFLTALGFGYGNYQDDRLEHLADKGNGNYAYIDRLSEARKVLVDELSGTLVTIAKDVKIQVEFNPLEVGAYRLIGYVNRKLNKEDFNDDRKDAGEIGAGHTVTALYELVPPGKVQDLPGVDPLRYQTQAGPSEAAESGETFTLKLRYKEPDGDKSQLLTFPVEDGGDTIDAASPDVKFAAAVAQFGLLLRDSEHKGSASFRSVEQLAAEGVGADPHGYRAEFLELIKAAEALAPRTREID
jgi:Ca-activated chloride channel family protein